MTGVPRALLETWPGRVRFPGVLTALAEHDHPAEAGPPDRPVSDGAAAELAADLLAEAVLAHVGGMPPSATFDALLDRGEHDAAERLLHGGAVLDGHQAELLARRLDDAREAGAESVRQRVLELARRAEAAGVAFEQPDVPALVETSRARGAAAEEVLSEQERELGDRVEALAQELERLVEEQERAAAADTGQAVRAGDGDFAVGRVRALLRAGELVTAQALLNREPLGVPVPEALAPLPVWDRTWTPDTLLEYQLNPAMRRPPEFMAWKAADEDAERLLAAFGRLGRETSPEAAEGFADALGRFLGGPGEGAVAHRIDGGYFTFFDGLFSDEPLSGLHPTGRVDLFVADPGTTAVPAELAAHDPHVAIGPGLLTTGYTDRTATAVLSLRDLLGLAVLPADRAARTLGILARQWPVEALIGDSPAVLERNLGRAPDAAWRALRWITHMSLRGGTTAVRAMERCTGMDPGLLWVMLRYAQNMDDRSAGGDLWPAETGGWRKDKALVRALRAELLARCGEPAAQAAWWAALSVCDPEDGRFSLGDLGDWAEICSGWTGSRAQVLAAIETLVARGLLVRAEHAGERVPAQRETPEGDSSLRVPLSGAVRALRPSAEQELTVLLKEIERAGGREGGVDDAASVTSDAVATPVGWTAWHRNRFAPVPSYARYVETEQRGADAEELATLADLAGGELLEHSLDDLVVRAAPRVADLGAVLTDLTSRCKEQYREVRVDLRCPASLWVDVPEPVLRAVLYEVLDNAAEALTGLGAGLVQVSVSQESPEVIVEVQDNGPGLPPEARGWRVFQPEWTTRGPDRGWGLHRVRKFLRALPESAVEAEAQVFRSSHPALTGAALRLVLPELEGVPPLPA
ncbi:ATP-binding protein [Streptomyces sp. NBC_01353]|uniref:ATP-binding protein n=1 Tax=Streptomyces sp. NBC_01353 TaxID=2903835 RepID=UPI002E2EE456|nr:ATP-binding protein [Streptomyces sp. NBC_01353]